MSVTAAFRGKSAVRVPTRCGISPLADVADGERRDGRPQRLIGRKHPVIAMPMLPRRRHEIGEPIEKLKRRELDDANGPRPRGLPPATPPDPVGRLVPRHHVADAGDPAAGVADHGTPFECEGRPRTVSQEMLERLKTARYVAVEERDADARISGTPAVLPGEHVDGGLGIDEPPPGEPSG